MLDQPRRGKLVLWGMIMEFIGGSQQASPGIACGCVYFMVRGVGTQGITVQGVGSGSSWSFGE